MFCKNQHFLDLLGPFSKFYLIFMYFSLFSVECGQRGASYVTVRNGGEPNAPILWSGCGNTGVPQLQGPIRSMSNKIWIESHLEGSGYSFR